MEDYVAEARRHQEVCQDFLAANPTQHRCTILRSKDMSQPTFKPGDTVAVTVYEKVTHEVAYVLSAEDFGESGGLNEEGIEASVVDTLDWNQCSIEDRSIEISGATS